MSYRFRAGRQHHFSLQPRLNTNNPDVPHIPVQQRNHHLRTKAEAIQSWRAGSRTEFETLFLFAIFLFLSTGCLRAFCCRSKQGSHQAISRRGAPLVHGVGCLLLRENTMRGQQHNSNDSRNCWGTARERNRIRARYAIRQRVLLGDGRVVCDDDEDGRCSCWRRS